MYLHFGQCPRCNEDNLEETIMTVHILRRPEVETRTGLSRSTIYSRLDPKSAGYDETFPRPVKLGPRAVGWPEKSINTWLETRIAAARDAQDIASGRFTDISEDNSNE